MEHDELAQHLESLQRESCYRVDAVLKQSPVEITQRVFFEGENGAETGPYIRKFIKRDVGIGAAYERIFTAQQRGRRFKYIPDMLECYTRDDELVVVMELVRGQTLQEVVYERDPSAQLARDIFPMLCDAVSELHREFDPPIIHRDLKPSNIILTGEGLALIDFGISREYDETAAVDTTHFGTREFAPPEQFGFGQTGVYSDIYSLGMVLFFCLTEEIPSAQARKLGFRNPMIPEELRVVIERAVALDPAMRFGSADELKTAFLAASSESAGQAQAVSQAKQAAAGKSRRTGSAAKTFALVAVVVVACLVLAVGLSLCSKADSTSGSSVSSSQPSASANLAGTADSDNAIDTKSADDGGTESANSEGSTSGNVDTNSAIATSSANAGASQQTETPGLPSADSSASSTANAEEALAPDIDIQAAPKNGFDPDTNATVQVAGVEFQIPSYFMSNTSESGDYRYYYAETGSTVAMLMTGETLINEGGGRAEFEAAKDDFLAGMMETEAFDKITSSTDYELAGLSARVVTITGAIKGVPIYTKATFFFNPDSHIVGQVLFGQTYNAQFDYSHDFAKVIASAKRI